MKTEWFEIDANEIETFEKACKGVCEFKKYEDGMAYVEYEYPHNLYYLGVLFQINRNMIK